MIRFSRGLFILLICLVVVLMAPVSVHATSCASERSTAATMSCLTAQYEQHKDTLNTAFSQALLIAEQGAQDQIKEGQHAWITYRDLQCNSHTDAEDHAALKQVENLRCLSRLTEARIAALSGLYSDDEAASQLGVMPRWMTVMAQDNPDVFWEYASRMEFGWNCGSLDNAEADASGYYAMRGVRIKDSQEHKYEHVIGISDMPEAGKPHVKIFEIPNASCEGDVASTPEAPHLCSEVADLRFDIVAREVAGNEDQESCTNSVVVDDKNDISVIFSMRDNKIVMDVQDRRLPFEADETAPSDDP